MRKQLDFFPATTASPTALDAASVPADWAAQLPMLGTTAWQQLQTKVAVARRATTVYPPASDTFRALRLTPLAKVRVVILGQDPYHGAAQAHGLAFSVPIGLPKPPSLRNIFKELASDIPAAVPHGEHATDLTPWAEQGILLVNTTLTVEEAQPASHSKWGWGAFTDEVITAVSDHTEHTVFLLWGAHARAKAALIDPQRHHIIESVHPSPLSASRGFFGSRPFSRTNTYLESHHHPTIDW
jgi:uracil-DNA glycosylase